ncbi:MAG TPA: ankyrin repeat domain-containing protein [Pyrinomonadaceae bacterium]|nr:ankyrin repeat domain-containing protein [Pyrinomonadaceae bacterium]
MKRQFKYLLVALTCFFIAITLYFAISSKRSSVVVVAERQPPVTFIPNEMNKGMRCRANTLYLWEKVEDLESGVVNPYCAELQSKLLNAAIENDVNNARAALSQGASPDSPAYPTPHKYYETERPLVSAAWQGNTEIVKLLLDNGADVEQEYCCCMLCSTPLIAAIETGHAETVKLLLARGADVNHRDKYDPDVTALQRAEKKENQEIISLIRQAIK